MSIFGDALGGVKASELKVVGRAADVAGAPSNAAILSACQDAYAAHQPAVDACTDSANTWASGPGKVNIANIRSQQSAYQQQQLGADQIAQTQGTFNANANPDCTGIFGSALCKVNADKLFTTIGLGMSVYADAIIGGTGGLGCAWDLLGREGPQGYGYAQGEIGIALDAGVNIEVVIFNQLPTSLSLTTLGIAVGVAAGLGARLSVMLTEQLDVSGFTIGIGVGAGAGAVVFGGHIWNFG